EEAERLETGQEWIDRALDDDELGVVLEAANDLEPVEAPVPERGQDGELERALAELDLPFLGRLVRRALCHARYYVLHNIGPHKARFSAGLRSARSQRRPRPARVVGDDAVDAEARQALHLRLVVDGPRVHRVALAAPGRHVHGVDEGVLR